MIPLVLATIYLHWSVPLDAGHGVPLRFRFQVAAPNVTATRGPEPPLIWNALDIYDASLCAIATAPRTGAQTMNCSRVNPDTSKHYRTRAENDSLQIGSGGAPGVAAWDQEIRAVCISNNGSGCPCLVFPSAAGCLP